MRAQHRMRRRAGLGGRFWLLQQGGAFLVVTGPPIGLSQLELQPPNCGGEHIVPDGFSRSIRPSAAVADLVEAIWDWDIPDGSAATDLLNAGSLNSPENKSSEAFIPPSGSSRPTSVPSSTCM